MKKEGARVTFRRAKEQQSDVVNMTSAFVIDARDENGESLISSPEDLNAVLKGLLLLVRVPVVIAVGVVLDVRCYCCYWVSFPPPFSNLPFFRPFWGGG